MTYDILVFQHDLSPGDQRTEQVLFAEGMPGMVCTGVQKLAQRVLCNFQQELGSVPHNPNVGTRFMTAVRRGELRSELDVAMEFNLAAAKVTTDLQSEELPEDPPEERLEKLELQRVVISPGTLKLYILMTTVAGPNPPLELPVSMPR